MSSLSISVTGTRGPSSCARALALIHPAVPPPSTTMRILLPPLIVRRSADARCRRGPAFHLFEFLALGLLDEALDEEEADHRAARIEQLGVRKASRPPSAGSSARPGSWRPIAH